MRTDSKLDHLRRAGALAAAIAAASAAMLAVDATTASADTGSKSALNAAFTSVASDGIAQPAASFND